MDNQTSARQNSGNTAWQIIGRLVVSAIVLGITAFFTPGFSINNIWSLAVGKGFVGFVLAVITLYVTQYFVAGYSISWMAAIIGALIYGVIDYFIPGEQEM